MQFLSLKSFLKVSYFRENSLKIEENDLKRPNNTFCKWRKNLKNLKIDSRASYFFDRF